MSDVFVGEDRRRVVELLLDRFETVAAGGGSRMVCVSSPPGWCKTRVVQELYGRLAEVQPAPHYWPDSLLPEDSGEVASVLRARKRVYPTHVDVAEGAAMPWMWWGLLCGRRDDGTFAQVLWDDSTQLYAHAGGIVSAKDLSGAAAGGAFDASSALIGVLGLLGLAVAPPVGVALTVAGAVKVGWDQRGLAKRLQAWRKERGERSLDAGGQGRDAAIGELIEGLVAVSRKVPVVVVIDDAHLADSTLIEVVAGLLDRIDSRVLFVATTWPVAAEDSDALFTRWLTGELHAAAGQGGARVERVELGPLEVSDVAELLAADLPTVDPAAIGALLAHVGNNPLTARVLVRTDKVRSVLERGVPTSADLAGVPRKLEDAFAAYWDELPAGVRRALAFAAQAGATYVPPPVAAAATAQELADATDALHRGVDPYAWGVELDEHLQTFVEPAVHEIARRAGTDELLTAADIDAVRTALVDAAIAAADNDTVSAEARTLLWRQHVTLATEGLAATAAAAHSAATLAEQTAEGFDYPTAIHLCQLALTWTDQPADHPDTLTTRGNLASWLGRSDASMTPSNSAANSSTTISGYSDPTTPTHFEPATTSPTGSASPDTSTRRSDSSAVSSTISCGYSDPTTPAPSLPDTTSPSGSSTRDTLTTLSNSSDCSSTTSCGYSDPTTPTPSTPATTSPTRSAAPDASTTLLWNSRCCLKTATGSSVPTTQSRCRFASRSPSGRIEIGDRRAVRRRGSVGPRRG